MKHRNMRLQFFAEPVGAAGEGGNGTSTNETSQSTAAGIQPAGQGTATIDYAKIQQMLDGTLAAKEDTALKAYFKQQGLSQQEAEQAMATFKAEKARNQPDVAAMQTQLAAAQAEAQKAHIENAATMVAVGLGVEAKTIPYLLKMADLSQAMGADGKVNEETVKNALNAVLEAVPGLKPQTAAGSAGFVVGAAGGNQPPAGDDALKKAFGL